MTWLETWIGVLLGGLLVVRVGRDAVRRAATAGPAEPAPGGGGTPRHGAMVPRADRVPTWLLGVLVVMTLGPRLVVLLV